MTTVIILAGGEGKRMDKNQGPKVIRCVPMGISAKGPSASRDIFAQSANTQDVPSGPPLPMIVRILSEVNRMPYKRILIVVGKHKELIDTVIQEHVAPDMLSKITYVLQPVPKGTGHAVMCCLHHLHMNDNVLILSGDVPLFSTESMRGLLNYTTKSAVIVSTFLEEPRGYGRIIDSKIVEDKDCSDYEKTICNVNCGIYAFSNRFLCEHLPTLNNQNAQNEYYLTSIFDHVCKDEVMLFEINKDKQHEVRGVNTKEDLSLLGLSYRG